MLVAGANSVKQSLSERRDIFPALPQGRNSKTHGGKPEGQVGQ
jgi:hypothetical protein